ncbi:MAG TPA: YihY/virulence factor BrkB family protein [Planctomycetota bacterium]|nr:YihY/virulence factor BrkB family protein [Planctomycetota bacterium]
MKKFWNLLKTTFDEYLEDKAPRLGAALAFYAMFALAPLLVVAVAIAGLVLGNQAAQGQLVGTIAQYTGPKAAETIQGLIEGAWRSGGAGIFATVISFLTLIVIGSGLFAELQDALDTIWEVTPRPGKSWGQTIRDRFFQFLLVIGAGIFLIASVVASTVTAALIATWGSTLPGAGWISAGVNFAAPIILFTFLFALIFKFLPDVDFAWSDVWIGAFATAVLLTIGKYLISLYLAHSTVASTYGAAGSLAVLMLWIYYSAQILFLGAEFTQVYAKHYGHGMRPKADAIPLTEEARAQQGIPHKGTLKPA